MYLVPESGEEEGNCWQVILGQELKEPRHKAWFGGEGRTFSYFPTRLLNLFALELLRRQKNRQRSKRREQIS